jgi:hypothetical protein
VLHGLIIACLPDVQSLTELQDFLRIHGDQLSPSDGSRVFRQQLRSEISSVPFKSKTSTGRLFCIESASKRVRWLQQSQ